MPARDITIVPVRAEDAAAVSAFVAHLLDELTGGAGPGPQGLLPVARDVLAGGNVTGFWARAGGADIGLIMLNECAAVYAGGRFGEISELYVDPAWRSRGIAARLVEQAVEHGRAKGWHRLEVGAPSQPAWARTLSFYKRNGFDETGPRLRRLI
ncbi:GNAT family N-acetyltransferase [Roseobacteraceae bacterium NS-SX3]